MTRCAIRLNTILTTFYQLISRLEFELTGYIILHKLLGLVFAVVGSALDVDAVAKMLFDEQYRPALLLLITEGSQTAGIDKGSFLGEIVAKIGKDFALFIFHIARYPKILLESYFLIPPDVLIIPHSVGTSSYHL